MQGHIGLVPEDEAVPGGLTPRDLARYRAKLHAVTDREAPDRWLEVVGLLDVADRVMDGFSKGMRQRAKVAAALVSNPTVLILDEPLNGADPVQRANLIRLFRQLGDQGRTVLVSSHVLYEVERLAERVMVLVRGRLAAAGDRRAIRDAMADRPRRVLVRADPPRVLAAALAGHEAVGGLEVEATASTWQRAGPATWPWRCPAWPAPPVSASGRSRLSTSLSRPCSGSWSGDGADASAAQAGPVRPGPGRPHRRLHAQGLLPHQAAHRVVLPAAGAVLFAALLRVLPDRAPVALAQVAGPGLFGVVLPVGCLVIGDAVLGAEVRSGTLHFTWLSPASFAAIVLGRWIAGLVAASRPSWFPSGWPRSWPASPPPSAPWPCRPQSGQPPTSPCSCCSAR